MCCISSPVELPAFRDGPDMLERGETYETYKANSGEPMKCPKCVDEGLSSRINIGPTFSTLMATFEYYAEDGTHVVEDPNTRSTEFSCSNGHAWCEKERRGEKWVEWR